MEHPDDYIYLILHKPEIGNKLWKLWYNVMLGLPLKMILVVCAKVIICSEMEHKQIMGCCEVGYGASFKNISFYIFIFCGIHSICYLSLITGH